MSWMKLAGQMRGDPVLKDLDEEQVEAVIQVLALAVYADAEVGLMEKTEFDDMMVKLPWMEDKETKVETLTKRAMARAKEARADDAIREMAGEAATRLGEPAVRERVYRMAATIACVDLHLHPDESRVLKHLAEAFAIDEGDAQRIIEEVS